jgi:hypothetical protein
MIKMISGGLEIKKKKRIENIPPKSSIETRKRLSFTILCIYHSAEIYIFWYLLSFDSRATQRARTSTRSIGFCAIWICISSSSSWCGATGMAVWHAETFNFSGGTLSLEKHYYVLGSWGHTPAIARCSRAQVFQLWRVKKVLRLATYQKKIL